jgi:hypothetical protein
MSTKNLDVYEFVLKKSNSVEDCVLDSSLYLEVLQTLFNRSVNISEKRFGHITKLLVDNLDPETIWEELQCRNRPHNRYLRKITFLKNRMSAKKQQIKHETIYSDTLDDQPIDLNDIVSYSKCVVCFVLMLYCSGRRPYLN